MKLEIILSIMGFAISLGGFAGLLSRKEGAKKVSIIVVVSALLLLSVYGGLEAYRHQQAVTSMTAQIIGSFVINEEKTFEEICWNLIFPDYSVVTEALDTLITSGRVGHRLLTLRSDAGKRYVVRVYYVL